MFVYNREVHDQWRIQDFQEDAKMGVLTYYLATFLPQSAWTCKNLDWGGEHLSPAPSSDPAMMTKRTSTSTVVRRQELNCGLET